LSEKHRNSVHQGDVGQRSLDIAGPVVGHLGKIVADGGKQSIAVEMNTHFDFVGGPSRLMVLFDLALRVGLSFSSIEKIEIK
jgi:hypothetical protein